MEERKKEVRKEVEQPTFHTPFSSSQKEDRYKREVYKNLSYLKYSQPKDSYRRTQNLHSRKTLNSIEKIVDMKGGYYRSHLEDLKEKEKFERSSKFSDNQRLRVRKPYYGSSGSNLTSILKDESLNYNRSSFISSSRNTIEHDYQLSTKYPAFDSQTMNRKSVTKPLRKEYSLLRYDKNPYRKY
mmetsp:Transcript_15568/g.13606  ORF Transcript_15568/g.13606 Transcript_15568/m.13606 type:complete len:184 (-) Transcript_15568:25-576(-)